MSDPGKPDRMLRSISAAFLNLEHALYAALGGLLAMVAVAALCHAAIDAAQGIMGWTSAGAIFSVIDQLLFVLMLVEILHTVRVSLRSGGLNAEPFLIVGLIASIRRVLVITLESSQVNQPGKWTPQGQTLLYSTLTELGVLGALILTMVVSIWLIRQSEQRSQL